MSDLHEMLGHLRCFVLYLLFIHMFLLHLYELSRTSHVYKIDKRFSQRDIRPWRSHSCRVKVSYSKSRTLLRVHRQLKLQTFTTVNMYTTGSLRYRAGLEPQSTTTSTSTSTTSPHPQVPASPPVPSPSSPTAPPPSASPSIPQSPYQYPSFPPLYRRG